VHQGSSLVALFPDISFFAVMKVIIAICKIRGKLRNSNFAHYLSSHHSLKTQPILTIRNALESVQVAHEAGANQIVKRKKKLLVFSALKIQIHPANRLHKECMTWFPWARYAWRAKRGPQTTICIHKRNIIRKTCQQVTRATQSRLLNKPASIMDHLEHTLGGAVFCAPTSTFTPLVSSGVQRVTEERGNVIARMLALQVHPEQIAFVVGVSLRTVYRVRENCQANGGAFSISRGPSKAGRPRLIDENDINVSIFPITIFPASLSA
jgi:hypothetical protein